MNRLSLLLALAALPAAAEIVPGLEDYGSVTLVDSIDCATDTTHRFREYPAGKSYVTNILGRATRVLHHQSNTGSYVSWRVGEGRGIVPNDPYVLVVDYPDEAPRSVTLMNFGNGTRHGWHNGFTVGDSMSPPYVTQSLESWAIPFSGEWKQVVEVMIPYKKAAQYDGGSRIDVATEGFDVDFALIKAGEATDSVGLAVSAIRLYKIDSYDVARPSIPYPAGDLPRRLVTSREEMGDNDNHDAYSDDPTEFYKGRAKMIRLLGMNGCSKDMLEFGYMQNWDTFGRGWKWGYATDYWTKAVEYLGEEEIDILPFYEYHGSRGSGGIGYNQSLMPWTLEAAAYPDRKFYFSNQLNYVANCMADLTNDEVLWDLEELFRLTVLNLSDKAHFRGMWLRNRGGMPMGFNDHAISLFNDDTGRTAAGTSVTRAQIYNGGNYAGTDLYNEYRAWWYGKRRDLFARLRAYMASNLDGARLYYSNTIEEPGEFWAGWKNPLTVLENAGEEYKFQGKTFREFSGKTNARTSVGWTAGDYWTEALAADCPTWDPYEVNHSAPADDPHNYTNLTGVALCYPFNCVWTVAADHARRYRTAGDDLPFVRHYSLNENDLRNGSNAEICGYYTCDWDHAGRAVMLSELYAMAYSDPTMLAYLFGSNLGRTDSVYVREFNLNYLSLPAMKGTVLQGGAWPSTFTVRKWAVAADTNYWAVINCDSKPWSGTVDFKTSKSAVWHTVGGATLELSGGKASLSLEPFQMVCFSDIEPEHVETPVFRYGFAEDVEARRATLSATLSDLGEGSGSATVSWTLSGGPADETSGSFPVFDAHGTRTVPVSGLDADTVYTVSLLAVNERGKSSTMEFSFRTAVWPFAFHEPVAVTSAEGTNATATVKLFRADAAGTLSLVVDGAVVQSWNDPVPGQAYSASFAIPAGREKSYRFVVVDPLALYETAVDGRVFGRKTIGWFDVAFDDVRYSSWTLANGTDPADGGAWTKSGDGNESVFAANGGDRRVDLATGEQGAVRYEPSPASPSGCKVLLSGSTELVAEYGEPAALDPSPLAGFALGRTGTAVSLYGWTADGWVALEGVRVSSPCRLDWFAEFDFDAGTVSYRAASPGTHYETGDPVHDLSNAGRTALPLGNAKTRVSSVTYVGNGTVDDFDGVYYIEEKASDALVTLDAAIKPGTAGLHFTNRGTDTEHFVISMDGATPGLWYVAFATDEHSSDPADWECVSCVRAAGTEVDLSASSVDGEGNPIPSRFFKIYGAPEAIAIGTPLSDLIGND